MAIVSMISRLIVLGWTPACCRIAPISLTNCGFGQNHPATVCQSAIDRVGLDSRLLQDRANFADQLRIGKLSRGDVDAHGERWIAAQLRLPFTQLLAGFV